MSRQKLCSDRNWGMYIRRLAGETYEAIAVDYKLTSARVRQVVKRIDCFTADNFTEIFSGYETTIKLYGKEKFLSIAKELLVVEAKAEQRRKRRRLRQRERQRIAA